MKIKDQQAAALVAQSDAMIAELKQSIAAQHVDNTDAHAAATARVKEREAYVAAHPELIPWKAGQGKVTK